MSEPEPLLKSKSAEPPVRARAPSPHRSLKLRRPSRPLVDLATPTSPLVSRDAALRRRTVDDTRVSQHHAGETHMRRSTAPTPSRSPGLLLLSPLKSPLVMGVSDSLVPLRRPSRPLVAAPGWRTDEDRTQTERQQQQQQPSRPHSLISHATNRGGISSSGQTSVTGGSPARRGLTPPSLRNSVTSLGGLQSLRNHSTSVCGTVVVGSGSFDARTHSPQERLDSNEPNTVLDNPMSAGSATFSGDEGCGGYTSSNHTITSNLATSAGMTCTTTPQSASFANAEFGSGSATGTPSSLPDHHGHVTALSWIAIDGSSSGVPHSAGTRTVSTSASSRIGTGLSRDYSLPLVLAHGGVVGHARSPLSRDGQTRVDSAAPCELLDMASTQPGASASTARPISPPEYASAGSHIASPLGDFQSLPNSESDAPPFRAGGVTPSAKAIRGAADAMQRHSLSHYSQPPSGSSTGSSPRKLFDLLHSGSSSEAMVSLSGANNTLSSSSPMCGVFQQASSGCAAGSELTLVSTPLIVPFSTQMTPIARHVENNEAVSVSVSPSASMPTPGSGSAPSYSPTTAPFALRLGDAKGESAEVRASADREGHGEPSSQHDSATAERTADQTSAKPKEKEDECESDVTTTETREGSGGSEKDALRSNVTGVFAPEPVGASSTAGSTHAAMSPDLSIVTTPLSRPQPRLLAPLPRPRHQSTSSTNTDSEDRRTASGFTGGDDASFLLTPLVNSSQTACLSGHAPLTLSVSPDFPSGPGAAHIVEGSLLMGSSSYGEMPPQMGSTVTPTAQLPLAAPCSGVGLSSVFSQTDTSKTSLATALLAPHDASAASAPSSASIVSTATRDSGSAHVTVPPHSGVSVTLTPTACFSSEHSVNSRTGTLSQTDTVVANPLNSPTAHSVQDNTIAPMKTATRSLGTGSAGGSTASTHRFDHTNAVPRGEESSLSVVGGVEEEVPTLGRHTHEALASPLELSTSTDDASSMAAMSGGGGHQGADGEGHAEMDAFYRSAIAYPAPPTPPPPSARQCWVAGGAVGLSNLGAATATKTEARTETAVAHVVKESSSPSCVNGGRALVSNAEARGGASQSVTIPPQQPPGRVTAVESIMVETSFANLVNNTNTLSADSSLEETEATLALPAVTPGVRGGDDGGGGLTSTTTGAASPVGGLYTRSVRRPSVTVFSPATSSRSRRGRSSSSGSHSPNTAIITTTNGNVLNGTTSVALHGLTRNESVTDSIDSVSEGGVSTGLKRASRASLMSGMATAAAVGSGGVLASTTTTKATTTASRSETSETGDDATSLSLALFLERPRGSEVSFTGMADAAAGAPVMTKKASTHLGSSAEAEPFAVVGATKTPDPALARSLTREGEALLTSLHSVDYYMRHLDLLEPSLALLTGSRVGSSQASSFTTATLATSPRAGASTSLSPTIAERLLSWSGQSGRVPRLDPALVAEARRKASGTTVSSIHSTAGVSSNASTPPTTVKASPTADHARDGHEEGEDVLISVPTSGGSGGGQVEQTAEPRANSTVPDGSCTPQQLTSPTMVSSPLTTTPTTAITSPFGITPFTSPAMVCVPAVFAPSAVTVPALSPGALSQDDGLGSLRAALLNLGSPIWLATNASGSGDGRTNVLGANGRHDSSSRSTQNNNNNNNVCLSNSSTPHGNHFSMNNSTNSSRPPDTGTAAPAPTIDTATMGQLNSQLSLSWPLSDYSQPHPPFTAVVDDTYTSHHQDNSSASDVPAAAAAAEPVAVAVRGDGEGSRGASPIGTVFSPSQLEVDHRWGWFVDTRPMLEVAALLQQNEMHCDQAQRTPHVFVPQELLSPTNVVASSSSPSSGTLLPPTAVSVPAAAPSAMGSRVTNNMCGPNLTSALECIGAGGGRSAWFPPSAVEASLAVSPFSTVLPLIDVPGSASLKSQTAPLHAHTMAPLNLNEPMSGSGASRRRYVSRENSLVWENSGSSMPSLLRSQMSGGSGRGTLFADGHSSSSGGGGAFRPGRRAQGRGFNHRVTSGTAAATTTTMRSSGLSGDASVVGFVEQDAVTSAGEDSTMHNNNSTSGNGGGGVFSIVRGLKRAGSKASSRVVNLGESELDAIDNNTSNTEADGETKEEALSRKTNGTTMRTIARGGNSSIVPLLTLPRHPREDVDDEEDGHADALRSTAYVPLAGAWDGIGTYLSSAATNSILAESGSSTLTSPTQTPRCGGGGGGNASNTHHRTAHSGPLCEAAHGQPMHIDDEDDNDEDHLEESEMRDEDDSAGSDDEEEKQDSEGHDDKEEMALLRAILHNIAEHHSSDAHHVGGADSRSDAAQCGHGEKQSTPLGWEQLGAPRRPSATATVHAPGDVCRNDGEVSYSIHDSTGHDSDTALQRTVLQRWARQTREDPSFNGSTSAKYQQQQRQSLLGASTASSALTTTAVPVTAWVPALPNTSDARRNSSGHRPYGSRGGSIVYDENQYAYRSAAGLFGFNEDALEAEENKRMAHRKANKVIHSSKALAALRCGVFGPAYTLHVEDADGNSGDDAPDESSRYQNGILYAAYRPATEQSAEEHGSEEVLDEHDGPDEQDEQQQEEEEDRADAKGDGVNPHFTDHLVLGHSPFAVAYTLPRVHRQKSIMATTGSSNNSNSNSDSSNNPQETGMSPDSVAQVIVFDVDAPHTLAAAPWPAPAAQVPLIGLTDSHTSRAASAGDVLREAARTQSGDLGSIDGSAAGSGYGLASVGSLSSPPFKCSTAPPSYVVDARLLSRTSHPSAYFSSGTARLSESEAPDSLVTRDAIWKPEKGHAHTTNNTLQPPSPQQQQQQESQTSHPQQQQQQPHTLLTALPHWRRHSPRAPPRVAMTVASVRTEMSMLAAVQLPDTPHVATPRDYQPLGMPVLPSELPTQTIPHTSSLHATLTPLHVVTERCVVPAYTTKAPTVVLCGSEFSDSVSDRSPPGASALAPTQKAPRPSRTDSSSLRTAAQDTACCAVEKQVVDEEEANDEGQHANASTICSSILSPVAPTHVQASPSSTGTAHHSSTASPRVTRSRPSITQWVLPPDVDANSIHPSTNDSNATTKNPRRTRSGAGRVSNSSSTSNSNSGHTKWRYLGHSPSLASLELATEMSEVELAGFPQLMHDAQCSGPTTRLAHSHLVDQNGSGTSHRSPTTGTHLIVSGSSRRGPGAGGGDGGGDVQREPALDASIFGVRLGDTPGGASLGSFSWSDTCSADDE